DDRRGPRAVEHDLGRLPRLDEVAEAPWRVAGPRPGHPVRVLLDRRLQLFRPLQPVDEVDARSVGRRPTTDDGTGRAEPAQAFDVSATMRLAPADVVVGRRDGDVEHDHRGPPRGA